LRLLFDQNLSARLVDSLADLFPGSLHVTAAGLGNADDEQVWRFAAVNDLVIVSKDEDFHQRAFLYGPPPKVVWVRLGNCTTETVEQALRSAETLLASFGAEPEAAFLVVQAETSSRR
jgi:predicted nuclease of predicted toxin-antitoxin system